MILLIDNYDSFSYNLYQLIGEISPDIKVIRNDELTVDEIEKLNPDRIILSPGSCKNDLKKDPDLGCMPRTPGNMRGIQNGRNLRKRTDARKAVKSYIR